VKLVGKTGEGTYAGFTRVYEPCDSIELNFVGACDA